MEITVYLADTSALEDAELFERLYLRAPYPRREKIDRLRFDRDKRLSLGAWVLLEKALTKAGVKDITLTYDPDQKPRLADPDGVKFNLSHSGRKVMCAVSDHEIGCDAEQIKDIDLKLAERFFYREEYLAISEAADSRQRSEMFFRYWTLKESFMKATGLGFRLPLDAFCILLDESRITVRLNADSVRQTVDSSSYYFKELNLSDGYRYAVCSKDKPIEEFKVITAELDKM